jgi:hypothetical protein
VRRRASCFDGSSKSPRAAPRAAVESARASTRSADHVLLDERVERFSVPPFDRPSATSPGAGARDRRLAVRCPGSRCRSSP